MLGTPEVALSVASEVMQADRCRRVVDASNTLGSVMTTESAEHKSVHVVFSTPAASCRFVASSAHDHVVAPQSEEVRSDTQARAKLVAMTMGSSPLRSGRLDSDASGRR